MCDDYTVFWTFCEGASTTFSLDVYVFARKSDNVKLIYGLKANCDKLVFYSKQF